MAKFLQRLTMAAVLIGGLAALAVETAEAARPDRPGRRAARPTARRSFQLFAGATSTNLEVNRVYCGLTDVGEVCVDVTGSPVLGGGSWPRGTPDQYIFGTGIQIAGIIPSNAGFGWAGDTVGAWSIDTRGNNTHMAAVSGAYSSLVPDDLTNWPSAAYTNDPTLFNPALLGRPTISQQDSWQRYWDGDPNLLGGRRHTMGVVVDQRSLAWNFPTGNEDLVYFIFRFTNITARASSGVYANLAQYGYSPTEIDEIAALGDQFQSASEAAFNVQIPDGGYSINQTYVAFTADMDVGDATNNYATGNLPFALASTWKSDWREASWQFPSSIFSPPFAPVPGFVGVKYLKSPINQQTGLEFGTTIFTTYTNPSSANSPFPDPLGIYQGYRYISGTPGPASGDQSCQYPASRRICFLTQAPSDQRQMQSSGPFTLAPGQSEVVVVAYLFAPAMQTNGTFDLGPYIGNTTLLPGVVPSGDRLVSGLDTLRLIDRAMGWISASDTDGDLEIDQNEVTVATGSLLDKSLVAQAVFDNQFLLPFAPDAPDFYLIPADNQVTVVWQTSTTETIGDPYFVVASDPTSALYDPNFRQYDVEGYRVWRGRSSAEMELIIQYDYAGTTMFDYTGVFYNGDYNDPTTGVYQCAPEIGVIASCPAFPHAVLLADGGPAFPGAVQVPAGGRVELASGSVLITRADTAVSGGGSGFPTLRDTDVPFAFVDNGVRNGYRYYYAVTAYDVNSLASGPSSLTSALITKSVTPRVSASTEIVAGLTFGVFGDDTVQLDPQGCSVTLDAATGRFSGPMCPRAADQIAAAFAPLVPQLLPGMTLEFRIDSVRGRTDEDFPCASSNAQGVCGQAYVTFKRGTDSASFSPQFPTPWYEAFAADAAMGFPVIPLGAYRVDADSESAARFGIPDGFAGFNASVEATLNRYMRYSSHENQMGRRILGRNTAAEMFSPGGSRWFDGANETVDHPAVGIRVGHVAGIDTIFRPLSHIDTDPATAGNQRFANFTPMQCTPFIISMWGREADIELTWGAGGTIASVRDITHRVNVPFRTVPEGSYGFFGDNNGNGKIDWQDFDRVELVWQSNTHLGFCYEANWPGAGLANLLSPTPIILPTSVRDGGPPASAIPTTGNGFGLYISGEIYIFQNSGAFTAPAAGTKWTLRQYAGIIAATNPSSATPTNYRWTDGRITSAGALVLGGAPIPPSPMIPGLRVVFSVPNATAARPVAADDLSRVHTVPDPYYVTNNAEITTNTKVLTFVNMPPQAIVRIYSLSGILVNVLTFNDAGLGGEMTWNLRNRNNQFVASGVYFYHIETATGQTRVGRFTVVNYAQ